MKKIEGVVIYYDDGSRERMNAQQIMERFFAGFTQEPSQNTSGVSITHVPTEPMVTEPEKQVANVDFVKESEEVYENKPPVTEPEKNIQSKPKMAKTDKADKDYRAATMTRFPFGGPALKGKSLLECVLWDRKFMERVALNKKGKNADIAKKISLVLANNPPTEDDD